MKEIKILQVIGGLNRGGAETMLMNIYRKIDRNRFKFVFLVYVTDDSKADYEDEILQNNDQIIKLQRSRVSNPILFYHDLNQILKAQKFDCVHAHTLFNSGIVMFAAQKNQIPIRITHSHSSGNMKKNTFINRMYFKFAAYLIKKYSTNSIACDVNSGKYLFGDDFEGPILHNGIDLEQFCLKLKKGVVLHPDLMKTDVIQMAIIASFYEVKNHSYLLSIARKMKEKGIRFRIYFAGRGPLQDMLEEQVKKLGLEQEIIFLGVVEKIYELLPFLDIILMPSLYEGVPVSLIEAQAAGVPAVISENISRDVDMGLGLLYYLGIENNEEEWIDTILKLSENKECPPAEERYLKLTEKMYNVDKNIEMACDIYTGEEYSCR